MSRSVRLRAPLLCARAIFIRFYYFILKWSRVCPPVSQLSARSASRGSLDEGAGRMKSAGETVISSSYLDKMKVRVPCGLVPSSHYVHSLGCVRAVPCVQTLAVTGAAPGGTTTAARTTSNSEMRKVRVLMRHWRLLSYLRPRRLRSLRLTGLEKQPQQHVLHPLVQHLTRLIQR